MTTCSNGCGSATSAAGSTMGGAAPTCASATQQAFGIGFGLRVNGNNLELDYCGALGCVAERAPASDAFVLFCDSQGLGKVKMSALIGDTTPVEPPAVVHPVYRLTTSTGTVKLTKDGVVVDSVDLCTMAASCSSGGGTMPNYTLDTSATTIKLLKDGVTVSNVLVPCTCSGGGGGTTYVAPVAVDDSISTPKDTAKTVSVLLNDTDADAGDTISLKAVSTPAHGTATISGTTVIYTPATGYVGADSFTYTIEDSHGLTDTGVVTVTVTATSTGGGTGGNLL